MIDALWMTSGGMFRSDARRRRSECVVALPVSPVHLDTPSRWECNAPEGVTDNQERDIDLVGVAQDLVRLELYRLPRRDEDLAAVECFLDVRLGRGLANRATYETLFRHHQDGRVRLEVDPLAPLDGLEVSSAHSR